MEPKGPERKIFRGAVVDATKLAKDQAHDIGEHRMTETKEDRDASWLTRTAKRIWKHNIAQGYYRKKEILKAQTEIFENKNLYIGEEGGGTKEQHEEAMTALAERFASEYDKEMLRKGEEKKDAADAAVKADIKKLLVEFAGNKGMSEDAFHEEKKRILSREDPAIAEKNKLYADNLLDIGKELRDAAEHGQKLDELDFDFELSFGKAQSTLSTEAVYNKIDKVTERVNEFLGKSRITASLASEGGVALAIAAAYITLERGGMSMLRNKVVKWGTFGATAVLAGGISAAKESYRFTRERAQHGRERAKGMEFKEEDMKRRKEMEKAQYEMKGAKDIISGLDADIALMQSGSLPADQLESVLVRLADVEARYRINDTKKIDLISFEKFDTVEKDSTKLQHDRATLKALLRRSGVSDLDARLNTLTDEEVGKLEKNELSKKDKVFREMKAKRVGVAFLKTAVVGGAVSFGLQEGKALIDSAWHGKLEGLVEGGMKKIRGLLPTGKAKEFIEAHDLGTGKYVTALRHWLMNDKPRMPFGVGHEEILNGSHVHLPDGSGLVHNPDGTYNILRNGEVVSKSVHLNFGPNGDLTKASKDLLAHDGVFSSFKTTEIAGGEHVKVPAADYLKQHPELNTIKVHRNMWYDNDTAGTFDKGELKEWWGGVKGTGIDENGNYVFNMKHMMPDGSYHGDMNIDAQEAMKKNGIKMIFSLTKDTQHQVFDIKIDEHGNAIIDSKSPLAKLMFETVKGHAVFKGQFAEVVEPIGLAKDGGENVNILSTYIGKGRPDIDTVIPKFAQHLTLDIPETNDYEVPTYLYQPGRRPLERGKYAEKKEGEPVPVPAKGPEAVRETEAFEMAAMGQKFSELTDEQQERFGPSIEKYGKTYEKTKDLQTPDGKNLFDERTTAIRQQYDDAMAKIGLDSSTVGSSDRWITWDLAKQRYLFENPTESSNDYELADPFGSDNEKILSEIANRQIGWEVLGHVREHPEFLDGLDKSTESFPKIEAVLSEIKGREAAGDQAHSYQLTELGRLVRENKNAVTPTA